MGEKGNVMPYIIEVEMIVIGSMQKHAFIGNGDYCPSLTEAMGKGGGQIPMIADIKTIGCMDHTIDNTLESANRVYDTEGLSPTINTCGDGGLQPKILTLTTENIPSVIELGDENKFSFIYEIDGAYYRIRIRKLTPRECWRLMGFTDEDYERAESVNSNTQLYKEAGNSIVKNVLMAIFGQMIGEQYA